MNDMRPYVCTFLDCFGAGKTYASRSALRAHLYNRHWLKFIESPPEGSEVCIFSEEGLTIADYWENRGRHEARHMEEIAFMVVTKPYEDWDFYSDASSDASSDNLADALRRHLRVVHLNATSRRTSSAQA